MFLTAVGSIVLDRQITSDTDSSSLGKTVNLLSPTDSAQSVLRNSPRKCLSSLPTLNAIGLRDQSKAAHLLRDLLFLWCRCGCDPRNTLCL